MVLIFSFLTPTLPPPSRGRKCCENFVKLSKQVPPARGLPEATRSAGGASVHKHEAIQVLGLILAAKRLDGVAVVPCGLIDVDST